MPGPSLGPSWGSRLGLCVSTGRCFTRAAGGLTALTPDFFTPLPVEFPGQFTGYQAGRQNVPEGAPRLSLGRPAHAASLRVWWQPALRCPGDGEDMQAFETE